MSVQRRNEHTNEKILDLRTCLDELISSQWRAVGLDCRTRQILI